MKNYPSKTLCMKMARYAYEKGDERLTWVWLFRWGFHEMYLKGWVTG